MKYSQHLQNMAYLQNLNDKDNAVQMQYCQYQYLINKDNAVEMQYTNDRHVNVNAVEMQYTFNTSISI